MHTYFKLKLVKYFSCTAFFFLAFVSTSSAESFVYLKNSSGQLAGTIIYEQSLMNNLKVKSYCLLKKVSAGLVCEKLSDTSPIANDPGKAINLVTTNISEAEIYRMRSDIDNIAYKINLNLKVPKALLAASAGKTEKVFQSTGQVGTQGSNSLENIQTGLAYSGSNNSTASAVQIIEKIVERAVPGPRGPAGANGRDGLDGANGANGISANVSNPIIIPSFSGGAQFNGFVSAGSGAGSGVTQGGSAALTDATVSGNSSLGTVSGAGLSSCNATTSKLVYNSTNKLFECGVDLTSGGVGVFTSLSASSTNASSTNTTNLISTNATITNATATSLFVSALTSLSAAITTLWSVTGNFLTLNATTTNATTTNTTGLTTTGNLLVNGSSTLASTTMTNFTAAVGALNTLNVLNLNASLTNGFVWRGSSTNLNEATSTLFISNNGSVGIGTISPTAKLSVAGNIEATGSVNTSAVTGGYKIDNYLVLNSSSTNFSTLVGRNAGQGLTSSATGNTALGYFALQTATSSINNTAIGQQVLASNTTGSSNTGVGYGALLSNTTGTDNVAIGSITLFNNTTGVNNTATGKFSLFANTTGVNNSAYGVNSLSANITGISNSSYGVNSLSLNTTGSNNVAFGQASVAVNTTGSGNTASGYISLSANTTGSGNSAFGQRALQSNITGSDNVAVGNFALIRNTSATTTVAIGAYAAQGPALYSNQGGTYLGYSAGSSASTGSDFNTLIGYVAGLEITTGTNNVVLGAGANSGGLTTGSNNILIGRDVRNGLLPTASGQLNIGNLIFGTGVSTGATLSTGNIGIGTTTPTAQLSNTGSVRFAALGSAGASLVTDVLGNVTVSSDERLKDKQSDFTKGIREILKINPINYRWNATSGLDTQNIYTGFSAQNIQTTIPEAVATDTRGFLTLSDRPILATLVNSIKEMYKKIVDMTEEIITKKIKTDIICVGNRCVNEQQFGNMIDGKTANAMSNAGAGGGVTWVPTIPTLVITLTGPAEEMLPIGTTVYVDPGATAVYTDEHNSQSNISVTSDASAVMSTITVGTTTITYTAANGLATTTKVRSVILNN